MRKYKIKVNNRLKNSLGEMNPDTNKIWINVKAHKGDKAELASTIKHEIMHVRQPKATEKEVYKATAKTKISPQEQVELLKKVGFKPGDLINKVNESKTASKSNAMSKRTRVSIMGLV